MITRASGASEHYPLPSFVPHFLFYHYPFLGRFHSFAIGALSPHRLYLPYSARNDTYGIQETPLPKVPDDDDDNDNDNGPAGTRFCLERKSMSVDLVDRWAGWLPSSFSTEEDVIAS